MKTSTLPLHRWQPHPLGPCQLLLGALLVALVWSLSSGSLGISLPMLRGESSQNAWQVWWQLRVPRVMLGLCVGMLLSGSGAAMQGLFRNPLADPTLLGMASGAGLAVALWIVLIGGSSSAFGLYGQFLAGFSGAFVVGLLVFFIGARGQSASSLFTLLLAGLAINTLAGAGGGVLAFVASDEQLRQLSLWGMGSLANALWPPVIGLLICAPLALWGLYRSRHELDLLQLGELTAHGAGLDAPRLRRRVVLATALGVGISVALAGIIGFIGLLVPHCLRLWLGPSHRLLLPASMLGGAVLLVLADTLARSLAAPAELPVGLLTSLIGGPYFLWLLMRGRPSC
ncbi:FecCD family ABC transporter permease [Halomonas halocynthiae]|uniref:FecCD family ABC transporter permease n=1 Tax=Halomonas halocynthiae TaxID=176290 RepID=UPI000684BC26|nr:iron ABC transporter permease [Halomonas halocynthiae]